MTRTTPAATWLLRLALLFISGLIIWHYWPAQKVESVRSADGLKVKFRTQADHLEIYDNGEWAPFFIKGVNLGAALPGYDPGQLPITKEHYQQWFKMIQDMGANTIRVYTILQPVFYEALVEYNQQHEDQPLYFIQGVWSPEEDLIQKRDAYLDDIYNKFQKEILNAVAAVYGTADIPAEYGKASGSYRHNAGPYLVGWHIGTEWDPQMVKSTNAKHQDRTGFEGTYVSVKPGATPFENWLAEMLDHLAKDEVQFGWQHPLAFTNWVTTDPLSHPGEVLVLEDAVSVDATHLQVHNWSAGYYASFHAYPYYPDFFRLDETLHDVKEADGTPNIYRSYLRELKAHHAGIPVLISEYGVPSSLGVAHLGSMGRHQGGHNEKNQGLINASLTNDIYNEGLAGAIVFSWQDEWFKRTWNTMHFEIPQNRRKLWHNVLTNEQHFGVIAEMAGKENRLIIDGDASDWTSLKKDEKQTLQALPGWKEITMTHDEAYVYIHAELEKPFDPAKEILYMGVDTLPGGNKHGKELGSKQLDEGLETVFELGKQSEAELKIASNYNLHTRLYGKQYGMLPVTAQQFSDDSGKFDPWMLAVGLELTPPDAKKYYPFEEVSAGKLARGTTNPESPEFNSLAMWQMQGQTLELRIPWMLLGFSDPSSLQVIGYGQKEGKLFAQTTEGIRLVPWIVQRSDNSVIGLGNQDSATYPVTKLPIYRWKAWDKVQYGERTKQSYDMMKETFHQLKKPADQ
ncbi:hypothetical protein [Paenibacillus xerothermodurans]|uniref:Family 2 glycosyl transferase n=1 Tax=Paenibacillus xerothermodurans TaxID=1977292 RepID=A0A2W1NKL7_PAEXE|nr:hypothetical protein [Paenibacillus xerothermodurans]PZE19593.1 hypothetical protein CBW46_017920 [Paenibacillus xerothermodurans]